MKNTNSDLAINNSLVVNNNLMIDTQRKACKIMGVPLHSTDSFIRQSLLWLAKHGKFSIEGSEDKGWTIMTSYTCAGGHSLHEALAGAVFSGAVFGEEHVK